MKKNNLKLISLFSFIALVIGGAFFWKANSTSGTSNEQEFYRV